jgi:hypothetical protein
MGVGRRITTPCPGRRIPLRTDQTSLALFWLVLATILVGGCSDRPPDLPLPISPVAPPVFSLSSCGSGFSPSQCAAINSLLQALADEHVGTACEEVVNSALARFLEGNFIYGGESESVWGFMETDLPFTWITDLGFSDLGPTIIHEDIHHIYPHATELQAENLGMFCGQTGPI